MRRVALLSGAVCLAVGYAAGYMGRATEGTLHPFLYMLVANLFLPGALLVSVGAFILGCVIINELWTRAAWLWLRHKHRRKTRARLLRDEAPASEIR